MLKIENNIAPEYLIDLSRQEMSRLLVLIYFRYISGFNTKAKYYRNEFYFCGLYRCVKASKSLTN